MSKRVRRWGEKIHRQSTNRITLEKGFNSHANDSAHALVSKSVRTIVQRSETFEDIHASIQLNPTTTATRLLATESRCGEV